MKMEESIRRNFDLWGGSGQFEFKIEDDKPYKIKDFNVSPLNQNGSVLTYLL